MNAPLADRMRPQRLEEYIGQEHLVGEGKLLRRAIESGTLFSMVLWGPPGVGKTTLARIIAKESGREFFEFSATNASVKDIKEIINSKSQILNKSQITNSNIQNGLGFYDAPVVFIDEIHRFNKAQQDGFLPIVESGKIVLIGATTENPSFEIIKPLLSRVRVLVLKALESKDFEVMIERALRDEVMGLGEYGAVLEEEAKSLLVEMGSGDGRWVLSTLELAVIHASENTQITINNTQLKNTQITKYPLSRAGNTQKNDQETIINNQLMTNDQLSICSENQQGGIPLLNNKERLGEVSLIITKEHILEAVQERRVGHDKGGEAHYDLVSAFIKSMRASNVDAALYYLARMVEGGEDPLFIARRMVIFASEDVGIAQPTALVVANGVFRACEMIGYPECAINLAHGVTYLASCKKNRSSYDAYFAALEDVKKFGSLSVPMKLRNAPTGLMRELGYSRGYSMYGDEDLLPTELAGKKYFEGK